MSSPGAPATKSVAVPAPLPLRQTRRFRLHVLCPGDVFSSELVNIVSKSVSLVRSYGVYAGGFVPKTSNYIKTVFGFGIQFITYHVDSALLFDSATQALSHLVD